MSAVDTQVRLAVVLLSALVVGCTPHAVRVDCDKHLKPINASGMGKSAPSRSALPPQTSLSPKTVSDEAGDRQDSEP
jgi:hypothetical protein